MVLGREEACARVKARRQVGGGCQAEARCSRECAAVNCLLLSWHVAVCVDRQ
jgi:hypothetical protein